MIYPLPIQLAKAASTRPALHAALRTLEQLGYTFKPTPGSLGFVTQSDHYPRIYVDTEDPIGDVVFSWETDDCEDERIPRALLGDATRGQEAALRAVAGAINAQRARKR